ncbi:MAG: penicillin-binding transpeptidase domain-containing protein [Planctomycetaceae bacterium]
MRNQPLNSAFDYRPDRGDLLIDPPAELRLRSLGLMFTVAAVVVLVRTAWVQGHLQQRYLEALQATTVEYELIPARDGRILSETSDVFATDVDQYSVQIHYRWLQEPAADEWLNTEVNRHLSRTERRDSQRTEAFRSNLLQRRQMMHRQLCELTGTRHEDLVQRMEAIQQKVTRIADSVNRRRQERDELSEQTTGSNDSLLMSVAGSLRRALTTAPSRSAGDRIVVREEESWHEVFADVSLEIAAAIREQPQNYPGVRVIAGNQRVYPMPTVAPHLVGARTALRESDVSLNERGASTSGWVQRTGRFGVELCYHQQLHSVPGLRRIVRNRRQQIVETSIEREPVSGRDVVLTLDAGLQQFAEQLLSEALLDQPATILNLEEDNGADEAPAAPRAIPSGGCIIVMDVVSGRLLTAASAPRFSLNLFNGASSEAWDQAAQDQRHPFLSRATSMTLPPGSVMKAVTAVAALESGQLDPAAVLHCQGYLKTPDQHRCLIFRLYGSGHGDVNLRRAMAESCNVYFFEAAQHTGFPALREWCDAFELGRPTGVDLPFERKGNVPGSVAAAVENPARWNRELLGLSIGQSSLTVTPLQVARVMAAIANGGWLVTPHVVSADGTARMAQDVDDRPREVIRRRVRNLDADNLKPVQAALLAVVEDPGGTGYRHVRIPGIPIAGKTGTAETGSNRPDHAWFAGYVPATAPRYAVVVVLEHGGSGSRAAGPIAREIIRRLNEDGQRE